MTPLDPEPLGGHRRKRLEPRRHTGEHLLALSRVPAAQDHPVPEELPDYGPDFELTSGQALSFEDGALGAYNCYEPSSGTSGPLCVGTYTSGDYRYRLTLEGPTPPEEEVERMLSSMASAEVASAEPTSGSASPEATDFGLSPDEGTAREAAEQYYYAVDYEAWETTYYNLDSESKALFTQEEWIAKNQWYADHEGL